MTAVRFCCVTATLAFQVIHNFTKETTGLVVTSRETGTGGGDGLIDIRVGMHG